jgi:STE24 endopeptidase
MWVLIALLAIQFVISTGLSALNLRHLKETAADPPQEWAERLDTSQFPRVIAYTAARSRLGHLARTSDLIVTLLILLSGLLPGLARWATSLPVGPVWQGLVVLAVPAILAYLADVPWDLLAQFGVEKRYGFSTITVKTWLMDQAKSLLLSLVLGVVLGGGLLALIGWLGRGWWLPAWALFSLFQVLMILIAPVLILPLFNKFEPLRDEELRDQILGLARKANFPVSGVFQVDASLRSTHSNAFFAGLGKTRRIALYDTLIEQHTRQEILAVMAHEIGHWVKKHVLKTMIATIVLSGFGIALCALLLDVPWIYQTIRAAQAYAAVGARGPVAGVGLYVIGVLLSPLGLLLSPAASWFSRHNEYEADAYSLALYPHPTALEEGLVKLAEKNLANLFPHPIVVAFRYSHPPLLDRVAAIRAKAADTPTALSS